MGVDADKNPDELAPAAALVNRIPVVQLGGTPNTVKVPGDPFRDEFKRWYETNPPMRPPTSGNKVEYLIGGDQTFKSMMQAMITAEGPGDFIYLTGWFLGIDFPLINDPTSPNDPTTTAITTIRGIFKFLDSRGVQIRALLWNQTLSPEQKAKLAKLGFLINIIGAIGFPPELIFENSKAVAFINSLQGPGINNPLLGLKTVPIAGAILDSFHPPTGAHHQKILIVGSKKAGLIAFCGGCDINPDRIHPNGTLGSFAPGAPLHDVHCRVEGPAAEDLLAVFVERWTNHPGHIQIDKDKNGGLLKSPQSPPTGQTSGGGAFVQVAETYARVGGPLPISSPRGRTTIATMLKRAISAATEFIYVEDQYLVNMDIANLLASRVPELKHLTILIGADVLQGGGFPQISFRRAQFLNVLLAADPRAPFQRVRVLQLKPVRPAPPGPNTYVHSKTWIFDDRFAIVGSPNCNRRGLASDSETAVGVLDNSSSRVLKDHRAHHLRINLWAKHLNYSDQQKAELEDGIASVFKWDSVNLLPGAHVEPYKPDALSAFEALLLSKDRKDYEDVFDLIIDPF